MSEIQNANPTIRSAADLPSRRRHVPSKPSRTPSLGWLAAVVPPSADSVDPFTVDDDSSRSEDSDEGGETDEPIDEQEIYGK